MLPSCVICWALARSGWGFLFYYILLRLPVHSEKSAIPGEWHSNAHIIIMWWQMCDSFIDPGVAPLMARVELWQSAHSTHSTHTAHIAHVLSLNPTPPPQSSWMPSYRTSGVLFTPSSVLILQSSSASSSVRKTFERLCHKGNGEMGSRRRTVELIMLKVFVFSIFCWQHSPHC